ncbi:MAG: hypothetical protein WCX48_12345 [Bacteroidales bacterium]|jgi:hypothetical protein
MTPKEFKQQCIELKDGTEVLTPKALIATAHYLVPESLKEEVIELFLDKKYLLHYHYDTYMSKMTFGNCEKEGHVDLWMEFRGVRKKK